MTDTALASPPAHQAAHPITPSLLVIALFYGGMVTLARVLGEKQVAIGPLAVEAGIFPFLILVGLSSAVTQLQGKAVADRFVRWGFAPLVAAILLTLFVLTLPTDPDMYPPAKEAFPIILGQSWRMMGAGILAYGTSVTLNIWIFDKLKNASGGFTALRGFVAAALSQIVDTLIFISVSFYGERPIMGLMAGQMLAKVVLSAVLVPLIIWAAVRFARQLDGAPA